MKFLVLGIASVNIINYCQPNPALLFFFIYSIDPDYVVDLVAQNVCIFQYAYDWNVQSAAYGTTGGELHSSDAYDTLKFEIYVPQTCKVRIQEPKGISGWYCLYESMCE